MILDVTVKYPNGSFIHFLVDSELDLEDAKKKYLSRFLNNGIVTNIEREKK